MTIKIVQIPSEAGKETKCPTCKAARGETHKEDTMSYDEFFTSEERYQFAETALAFPDLSDMVPPTNARYKVRSKPSNDAARDQFESKKKKNKMKGEFHHPHPLKAGGCPIHQELVEKPVNPQEKQRADAVDKHINDVMNRAYARHGG